ncbi:nuclear transport factor 2 family protein [Caldimonas aquatica]|uniref:Nuclear transport factor 2 family protein n=1 Tax=Caldimonas aquatica TaxID=376175 RepID=A0ABY6MTD8_9BURK|nr:nuclear transport factor 2 family protein [Schlegelella aquatica]UZD55265.1 nuclear transport factor 2 family protein [Schlegelella aquatica]
MQADRPAAAPAPPPDRAAPVERLVRFFESMTEADLERLDEIYHPRCRFKDPFQEVQGLEAVRGVYAHMYRSLVAPRFVVHHRIVQGRDCMLLWDFLFAFRRSPSQPQRVRGCSHLVLDDEGRIAEHRDYWDAAEELYEKLPVLGSLMRWLKKQVRA